MVASLFRNPPAHLISSFFIIFLVSILTFFLQFILIFFLKVILVSQLLPNQLNQGKINLSWVNKQLRSQLRRVFFVNIILIMLYLSAMLSLNMLNYLDYIEITPTQFIFKLRLNKKLSREVSYVNFIIWLFFTGIPLDQPSQLGHVGTTFTSLFFYLSARLSLNMSNWLGHIGTTPTLFIFKLRLNKKLGREVSYVNFIFWFFFY